MKTILTPIEDFIKEDMERDQIAQDINALYVIINDTAGVNSSDYRCYVTPERELVILFLKSGAGFQSCKLAERINDETVMRSHGIEDVRILFSDYDESSYQFALRDVESGIRDLRDVYGTDGIVSPMQSNITYQELKKYPPYDEIIYDISHIEGFSLSTLFKITEGLSPLDEKSSTVTTDITLKARYIVTNTIEVFLDDTSKLFDIEDFKHTLENFKNYFSSDDVSSSQIDDEESITEKNQKEKLSTLQYIIGSQPIPFPNSHIIHKSRKIHIKLYLLLCVAYSSHIQLRRMERTSELRKNKKRNIESIQKILSGKTEKIGSAHIIAYMKEQNTFFNNENISESDLDILKELIMILENRPESYPHRIAKVMVAMFGDAHRPVNRFLGLMGFKSIGNSTIV